MTDRPPAPATESDADRLAREWIGCAMEWADQRYYRHPGPDYEQIAVDGLLWAIERYSADRGPFDHFLRRILLRMADRVIRDGRRRRHRRGGSIPISSLRIEDHPCCAQGPDPIERAEELGLARRLAEGLGRLPDREAAVLRAVCLEGRKQVDVAAEWGVSKQQVKQVYDRARGRARSIGAG